MADAPLARWHGDNYQARIFWENAFNLLMPNSSVVEVTFEANGPKAFDDVVVKYDPPVARGGPERITAEYHQVKWHVALDGRFGYEDLVDPEFIGATSVSLLQRLKQAQETAPTSARFAFITTYRIKDGDQLGSLVSGNDRSILMERLFDGTKTDGSRMGKVRKLWREHLQLASDEDLKRVVRGLRILEGHRSLEDLRSEINVKARVVGLLACETASDFRYDELARALKVRQLNGLTRETLLQLSKEEGLHVSPKAAPDRFLPIAIRSFLGPAADIVGAAPDDTLLLIDQFRERYLRDDRDWQADIRPRVETFLIETARRSAYLRVILDAHASIAFITGSVLDLKSGIEVELVQKGRVGSRTWSAADDTAASGAAFVIETQQVGHGPEFALAISVSQSTQAQATAYAKANLPAVGRIVHFRLPDGPGGQTVAGGGHAVALAEQVSNAVREVKQDDPDALTHVFAACPNALMFYLGQQHRAMAPCIVYEFDFDRRGNKNYQPTFVID